MPYALIQITKEPHTTPQLKEQLIQRITHAITQTLGKNPNHTFVVIQEIETDNWGIAGISATNYRNQTIQPR